MDANGLRFWMLASEGDWDLTDPSAGLEFDRERRHLRLASLREPSWTEDRDAAPGRLQRIPGSVDAAGSVAYWSAESGRVLARSELPGEVVVWEPDGDEVPSDVALGHDGILYLAVSGRVILVDLRSRWDPLEVEADELGAWRLAPAPGGGAWVLDRSARRLGRVRGRPLPERPGSRDADTFRPCPENPDPPRLVRVRDATWPTGESPVALACSPGGRLAVLSWRTGSDAVVRTLEADGTLSAPRALPGARRPYSAAWLSERRVAVLLAGVDEAPAYVVGETGERGSEDPGGEARLAGEIYPLRDHRGGPFLHGVRLPPRYPDGAGSRSLHRLGLGSLAPRGRAVGGRVLDGGRAGVEWHRLYLEASVPPECAVVVRLAATEEPEEPDGPAEWFPHRFAGDGSDQGAPAGGSTPRGAWLPMSSEVPFRPGLLACEPEPGRAGLFTALVQRAGRRVRALRGRYLWVRIELRGTGSATPEVAALRVYGSRFSYRDRYLPELYQEHEFGPDADAEGPGTPADFLERFLGLFESVLTPLEDRIAHAYLLTRPATAPDEALEWLASWIGLAFDPAYPPARRRSLLAAAPELARRRGTLGGLSLALELVTGGAVSGGEVVVLEEYRLRRTFATILGADLADEDDPLLGGIAVSGNSFVGDTLFLGDESRDEFLALFGAELDTTAAEDEAIASLFDRFANRVTVLVHEHVDEQELGLVRRVVELESPAHVHTRVVAASHPLIVGVASLVGIDTYLAERPEPGTVRVGHSRVGVRDLLGGSSPLDPRTRGGVADRVLSGIPPTADAGDDFTAPFSESFDLDGSGSRPGPGQEITEYIWSLER